jgi:hypothetical protein
MLDKKFIARSRLRFGLGVGIIGSFLSVINILTFAKVWQPTFENYGIPMAVIYIIMPVGYLSICWMIGYLYDVKGIWKEETSHSNAFLNPEFVVLCDGVVNLSDKVDEISKKLDDNKI